MVEATTGRPGTGSAYAERMARPSSSRRHRPIRWANGSPSLAHARREGTGRGHWVRSGWRGRCEHGALLVTQSGPVAELTSPLPLLQRPRPGSPPAASPSDTPRVWSLAPAIGRALERGRWSWWLAGLL